MRIRKNNPLPREAVKVGRRNLPFRVQALKIPITKIIAENEQKIGLGRDFRIGSKSRRWDVKRSDRDAGRDE